MGIGVVGVGCCGDGDNDSDCGCDDDGGGDNRLHFELYRYTATNLIQNYPHPKGDHHQMGWARVVDHYHDDHDQNDHPIHQTHHSIPSFGHTDPHSTPSSRIVAYCQLWRVGWAV